MKKRLVTLLAVMLVFGGLSTVASGGIFDFGKKNKAKKKGDEKIKIVIDIATFLDDQGMIKAIEEIESLPDFSNIDIDLKPAMPSKDYIKKMPVVVASGEQRDLIAVFNPIHKAEYSKGLIQPIDKFIQNAGFDFEKEYGVAAEAAKVDGKTFLIPNHKTSWVLYYNKKVFDEAGVAYPDPKVPMTWDEYATVAKKLTRGEGENKRWGALHLTWPMFWYGEAIMTLGGGEKFYNDEGLSNIENPAFAKALQRTYNMMHVDKSIPTHAEVVVGNTRADGWMNGQYGMYLQGAWLLQWAQMDERYPRDWELGIAPMPVNAESKTRKSWGIVDGFGVSATSKHPEEAVKVAVELTRIAKKYATNNPMANITTTSPMLFEKAGKGLVGDGLSKEIIADAFSSPEIAFVTEKVTGKNPSDYEAVIKEEVEKYFVQEQDLKQTIDNIKKRGDKAIKK